MTQKNTQASPAYFATFDIGDETALLVRRVVLLGSGFNCSVRVEPATSLADLIGKINAAPEAREKHVEAVLSGGKLALVTQQPISNASIEMMNADGGITPTKGFVKRMGHRSLRYAGKVASVREIKAGAGMIGAFWNAAFSRREYRRETFEDAVARLGLTRTDLLERAGQLRQRALMFYGIGLAILAYAVWTILTAEDGIGSFSALAALIISTSPLSMGFSAAFRHWQIRRGALGGFSEFVRTPGLWFPPSLEHLK